MNKNLITVLVFILIMISMLWIMPDMKVETIGDFFEKIITPISIAIAAPFTVKKIAKIWKGKKRSK